LKSNKKGEKMISKPRIYKDSEKLTVYGNAIENTLNQAEIKPRLRVK
jgi:hypothetical protein